MIATKTKTRPQRRHKDDRRNDDSRIDLGQRGEALAQTYLLSLGWVILDRNWRAPRGRRLRGELDLVALIPEDKDRGPCIVFVEVKTRRSDMRGAPAEAIKPAKLHRIHRLARAWCGLKGQGLASRVRVDVISVFYPEGGNPKIRHHQGVW